MASRVRFMIPTSGGRWCAVWGTNTRWIYTIKTGVQLLTYTLIDKCLRADTFRPRTLLAGLVRRFRLGRLLPTVFQTVVQSSACLANPRQQSMDPSASTNQPRSCIGTTQRCLGICQRSSGQSAPLAIHKCAIISCNSCSPGCRNAPAPKIPRRLARRPSQATTGSATPQTSLRQPCARYVQVMKQEVSR